jgi:uncharacterized membrane protein
MFLPSEIHAIISSAPLVLFLLSSVFSIFAIFIKKPPFNVTLFVIIAMGCLATYAAIYTGKALGAKETNYADAVSKIFLHHQNLAHKVLFTAILAASISLIQMTLSFFRPGRLYRLVAFVCLVFCIITTLILLQVSKTGMSLVYEHGVGVEKETPTSSPIEK